jgi:hypothetical protein
VVYRALKVLKVHKAPWVLEERKDPRVQQDLRASLVLKDQQDVTEFRPAPTPPAFKHL